MNSQIPSNPPVTRDSKRQNSKKYEYDSIIDLDAHINDINYDKMVDTINKTHARKSNGKPYSALDVCCRVSTGHHICCCTSKECDIEKFGVGMAIYFRFVKHLICFFILFSIFAVPSIYFSAKVSQAVGDTKTDYKYLLYYTTLGALGQGITTCGLGNLQTNTIIQFSCSNPGAVLDTYDTFEWGVSLADESDNQNDLTCDLYSVFSWDPTNCKNPNTTAITNEYQNCAGQSSCQFNVSSDFWDTSSCPNVTSQTYYFNAYCTGGTVQLGSRQIPLRVAGFIIAICDGIISILFLWMVFCLSIAERRAINNIRQKSFSSSLFTIEVLNLPKGKPVDRLRGALWTHFQEAINVGKRNKADEVDVVDVQCAQSHLLLINEIKLGDLLKKRKFLLKEFVNKFIEKKNAETIGLAEARAIGTKLFISCILRVDKANKNKKARGLYKKIEKVTKEIERYRKKIDIELANPNEKVVSAFVTFEKIRGRNEALAQFAATPFEQCCYPCCCCCYKDSYQVFDSNYLRVDAATDAQNVLWENLYLSKTSKFFRRLISLCITIALWAITIVIIVLIKDEQQTLSNNIRVTADCTGFDGTKEQVAADYALGSSSKGYVECYCRTDTFSKIDDEFDVNGSNEKLCETWLTDYSLATGLPFIVAFAILFINLIMRGYYTALSRFEGHRNLTKELSSKIIKVFISQFLNTGLIILIINAKFTNNSPVPFLRGQYDDTTVDWYYSVGATILLTMFINVFTFPVMMMIFTCIKKMLRCCDRGCSTDMHKTKKKTQKAYVALYTGAEFDLSYRYSQVLTLIFICMLYGSALPLLYIFTFFQLVFLYWIDKCFLFRINRLPRGYDEYLAIAVRRTLYYIIIIHLAFAIWNYGNQKIFENADVFGNILNFDYYADAISDSTSNQYYIERWLRSRIFKDQTIILTFLLLFFSFILFIKFIFQNVFKRFFQFCFMKCQQVKLIRTDRILENVSYYSVLTKEEIEAEIPFVKERIAKTSDETLRAHLNKRLFKLQGALQNKGNTIDQKQKFLGLFSYDIRHNPKFKDQFGVDVKSYRSRLSPQVIPLIEPNNPTEVNLVEPNRV